MAAQNDGMVIIWKGVLIQFLCDGIKSFQPLIIFMGLLRLKKDDNHKENTVGKIAKWRQIRKSTHAQIPILARFYSIM